MNATDNQPLTDRLERLTLEGRIAWHVERAASDFQRHLIDEARAAVARVEAATRLAA